MKNSRRVRLGDWTCPSGNHVEAFYHSVRPGFGVIQIEWDEPPPLRPADEAHYVTVVRPELIARIREYTERIGATLVLSP